MAKMKKRGTVHYVSGAGGVSKAFRDKATALQWMRGQHALAKQMGGDYPFARYLGTGRGTLGSRRRREDRRRLEASRRVLRSEIRRSR